ncbi:serine/threonine-protein kinase [Thermocladium modestius]|nr:serine/threonine-protein kinase [Thermocladium modestius]
MGMEEAELAIESLYDVGDDIIGLRWLGGEFIILTEHGNVYGFNHGGLRRVMESGSKEPISQYSWNVPHLIGTASATGDGTMIRLIDLRNQNNVLLRVNDGINGLLTVNDGLAYWGGGILEGYLGLFSGDGGWRIKIDPLQALTYDDRDEKLYMVSLAGSLIAIEVGKPTVQETLGKVSGRVTKIVKHGDELILAQPDKVSIINPRLSTSDAIGIRPLSLNLSGDVLVVTTRDGEIILRNLRNNRDSVVKVDGIYKAIQHGDEVYVLTKDGVVRIVGESIEKLPLGGLPVSHVAIGDGVSLSLFDILMHGTPQPPGIDVKAMLIEERERPMYSIEINAKTVSSLTPIKNEEVVVETDEGSFNLQLDDEGRATVKLPAIGQARVKITLKRSGAKPTVIALPSPDQFVAGGHRLVRGSRLSLDELHELIIQEMLGAGGFGEVYRAYSAAEDRYVAVKLFKLSLSSIEEGLESMLGEVSTLGRLSMALNTDRKRVVELYGLHKFRIVTPGRGSAEEAYGMVMEYVDGGSLRNVINSRASFTDRMRLIIRTSEALARLHDAGVIHGDLKPENILIKNSNPLLSDFGISRVFKHLGENVVPIGYTAEYAAPEVGLGIINDKSDVYSMGTLIIELLTGKLPLGKSTNLPVKIFNEIRTLERGGELSELVSRMRGRDPDRRPSMMDVNESLIRLYGQL